MITVTSPCKYKTAGGVGIDSDLEDVKEAYLSYIDPNSSNKNKIIAGTVYGGIIFKLDGQKVKSIFIGAAAE
jgi:peptide methionine sulfoxide reductase MsrA